MADKRMISKTIVDSDAFLDMPQTTQNLYFHLNIRADDEGFIDSPKKVMRAVGSNQNDLEVLLSKKYVLGFESGVIVVKHWKLHNTIRKDRIKQTLYIEEKAQLDEKPNGLYTQIGSEKGSGCQSAAECPPSIDKYSIDKYSIDKYSIDKKRKEKKKEEKNTLHNNSLVTSSNVELEKIDTDIKKNVQSMSQRISTHIEKWNSYPILPECRYNGINLPSIRDVSEKISVYSLEEINKAIENVVEFWEDDKHHPTRFHSWMTSSVDRWVPTSKPELRYKKEPQIDRSKIKRMMPIVEEPKIIDPYKHQRKFMKG